MLIFIKSCVAMTSLPPKSDGEQTSENNTEYMLFLMHDLVYESDINLVSKSVTLKEGHASYITEYRLLM